jgi:hypothetical protein
MENNNTEYYFWTEAEKDDLITKGNLDAMMTEIRK